LSFAFVGMEQKLRPDFAAPGAGWVVLSFRGRGADPLSGVFEGQTTGTPLGLIIHNTDQRSQDYSEIMDRFRPGHADYTYQQKYGRHAGRRRRHCQKMRTSRWQNIEITGRFYAATCLGLS